MVVQNAHLWPECWLTAVTEERQRSWDKLPWARASRFSKPKPVSPVKAQVFSVIFPPKGHANCQGEVNPLRRSCLYPPKV